MPFLTTRALIFASPHQAEEVFEIAPFLAARDKDITHTLLPFHTPACSADLPDVIRLAYSGTEARRNRSKIAERLIRQNAPLGKSSPIEGISGVDSHAKGTFEAFELI